MSKVKELARGQKVIILDKNYNLYVEAPLPETFTIGQSSEITAPFAGYGSDGMLAKLLALGGVRNKIGIITRKMYMSTETPEVTLELDFEAYEDAYTDVYLPCANLMMMSSGEHNKLFKASTLVESHIKIKEGTEMLAAGLVNADVRNPLEGGEDVALINFIKSPGLMKIYIGDTICIDDAYISAVNIEFSGVLDSNFMPMGAKASVTITHSAPVTKRGVLKEFKKLKNGTGFKEDYGFYKRQDKLL